MLFSLSLKSIKISLRGRVQKSITRVSSIVSVRSQKPRFSDTSASMSPIDSVGIKIFAFIIGSYIAAMSLGSGSREGLSISICVPSVKSILYTTLG